MKKKLFAAFAAALMLGSTMAAPVSAAETYKKGDVNMDGVIGLEDAMLVLQEYTAVAVAALPHSLTEEQLQLARVHPEAKRTRSSDGHLVDDAWTILMYYTASITDSAVSEQDIDSWIADYWGLK